MRILFVCSTGGHLTQLVALRPWWEKHERAWVTFDKPDARSVLDGERVWYAHHPTTRNVPNLLRNLVVARRVLADYRPDVVMSTGAGVAVPFFALARVYGARTAYLEVYDRIDSSTLTCRLTRPVTDLLLLQWEEQRKVYGRGVVVGAVL